MPCRKTTPCRLGALLVCALVFFAACQEPQNGESPSGSFVQSEDMIYEGGWAWEAMVPNRYNTSDERPVVSVWTLTDTHLSPLSDVSIGDIYDRDREYNIKVHYALTWHTPESAYRMYTQEEEDEQVRRLITELLAGEGPDVLILDGCNARDFAARGALMDLAGVAREMGVYENLTQGLVINGQLPYVPYLARAPLLWGPPEEVQGVESFAQLAESMMAGPTPQ